MLTRRARADRRQGRPLVIFPEGTRVPHGAGAAAAVGLRRALQAARAAGGAGRGRQRAALPPPLEAPGTITVRFGEPIPPGLPREEIEARVHAAINALNAVRLSARPR